MTDKQPKHDLRDDSYTPRATVTNTNERLAGAEPASLDPANEDVGGLLRPGIDQRVPDGQVTKSS